MLINHPAGATRQSQKAGRAPPFTVGNSEARSSRAPHSSPHGYAPGVEAESWPAGTQLRTCLAALGLQTVPTGQE